MVISCPIVLLHICLPVAVLQWYIMMCCFAFIFLCNLGCNNLEFQYITSGTVTALLVADITLNLEVNL